MEIRPKQPSAKGPSEMFTGDVWIDAIANGTGPSRASGSTWFGSPPAPGPPGTHMPSDHFMAHLSMTEGVGEGQGPESQWGAPVTDLQYRGVEKPG